MYRYNIEDVGYYAFDLVSTAAVSVYDSMIQYCVNNPGEVVLAVGLSGLVAYLSKNERENIGRNNLVD